MTVMQVWQPQTSQSPINILAQNQGCAAGLRPGQPLGSFLPCPALSVCLAVPGAGVAVGQQALTLLCWLRKQLWLGPLGATETHMNAKARGLATDPREQACALRPPFALPLRQPGKAALCGSL